MAARARGMLLGLTGGFALLDQLSKWLAQDLLATGHPFALLPGVLQLTLTHNTGAAFSLLGEHPEFLTLATSLIFLALLTYGLLRQHERPLERWALALILGGALGNLIDRFRWGQVTDFIDVVLIHYPIFNLADTFIFTGVVLFVWISLWSPERKQPPHGHL